MNIRFARPKTGAKVTSVIVAAMTAFVVLPVAQAQALGNNREVSRSCGRNYVASGSNSSTQAWAQTSRVNGDCTGRLSVTLRANNGFTHPRHYGNRQIAEVTYNNNSGFGTGLHWGCDDCNVTYS